MRTFRWPLWLLGALASSCSYSPSFEDGVLVCSTTKSCPKGYECSADGTCWKGGDAPDGGDLYANFVGTWAFESGTLNADCSDGPPSTMPLTGQQIPVAPTPTGTGVTATYYCSWVLHRAAGSLTAVADPNQSCVQDVPADASGIAYSYTWTAIEFSFTTTDGQRASVKGRVAGHFLGTDNSTGTCDGQFNGMLTRAL